MKIRGNTVGTPTPRTNWNQTDPAKADYLKGKVNLEQFVQGAYTAAGNAQTAADNAQTAADNARTAADNAQAAADNAQTTADNALKKSGDAMTGDIAMGGKKVTGLADPTDDGDAANKQYVDAKRKTFSATITTNDWTGSAAPYTQVIGIAGILAEDTPHISPVYSDDLTTALAQKEAWAMVCRAKAEADKITFICFEDKPTTNIPIQIEVNR